jgi:predicted transcriptional regulator
MHILEKHIEIMLVADILTINGMRFFITKSRVIKFITDEHNGDAYEPLLDKAIIHIKQACLNYRRAPKEMMKMMIHQMMMTHPTTQKMKTMIALQAQMLTPHECMMIPLQA